MPRDMVSDPFESAAAAQMRNAAEAGVEAHNISSAQRIIMQQPEDVGGQQAQLMRQREKYGDAVGLSSEQVARARGESHSALHAPCMVHSLVPACQAVTGCARGACSI